jgi:hypothetical protein
LIDQAEKIFETHSPSVIEANYSHKSEQLHLFVPSHLTSKQQQELLKVITKHSVVFDGKLGILPGKPVSLQLLSQNVRPYHGRAFPIPKAHDTLIKNEVQRLVELDVLQKINSSEWAAPSFGIPKKNGKIDLFLTSVN